MTTSKIVRVAFDQWFWAYFIEEERLDSYVNLASARGSFYSTSGMPITSLGFFDMVKFYCKTHHLFLNPKSSKGYDTKTKKILQRENGKLIEYLYIGKNNCVTLQKNSFQVLIDYPGSDFQKGQIIEVIEGRFTVRIKDVECSFDLDYFLKYPDIFKEL